MENLLTTILLECKKNKLMFRANAYELWNHGCETMIVPWGYDIKALQETLHEFEFDTRFSYAILLWQSSNYVGTV